MPPMPPAAPAVDEPEHVSTTPIDKTFDDELELDHRLDADDSSPRGARSRSCTTVNPTDSCSRHPPDAFAISLDGDRPLDSFAVTELALRPLVPRHRAWVVVVYASIRDGAKTTRFVACQARRRRQTPNARGPSTSARPTCTMRPASGSSIRSRAASSSSRVAAARRVDTGSSNSLAARDTS